MQNYVYQRRPQETLYIDPAQLDPNDGHSAVTTLTGTLSPENGQRLDKQKDIIFPLISAAMILEKKRGGRGKKFRFRPSKKGKKKADNSKAKSSKRQSSSSSGSSTKSKKAEKDKKDDKKKKTKKIRIDFDSEDEEEKKKAEEEKKNADEAEKARQADILKTWPKDSVELERIEDDTNRCPFVDFLKMLNDIPNDVVIMLVFK